MNWLSRMLSNPEPEDKSLSPSTSFNDLEGEPIPLSLAEKDARYARELVRAAAVRTSDAFGIPQNWLSYEVVTISDVEKAYFQLQIGLRIWDEHLWSMTYAYEQQFFKRIREDDVNVARAVRVVLWRVLPDAGCPHDELAGPEAWTPDAIFARSRIYERLRGELMLPSGSLPSVADLLDSGASTLPMGLGDPRAFAPTYPMGGSRFPETMPAPMMDPAKRGDEKR